ncbi:hypothetical protein QL285_050061 [Trifolium repens]|nr:hypothetical protein QL285_050061 [Trifolium repens]
MPKQNNHMTETENATKRNKNKSEKPNRIQSNGGDAANTFNLLTQEEKNTMEVKQERKNATEKERKQMSPPERKDSGAVKRIRVLITPPSVVVTSSRLDFGSEVAAVF